MQVFSKDADEVVLLYSPRDEVEVGENIKIWDESKKRGVIIQIIELDLARIPGILEDLIRNESIPSSRVIEHIPKGLKQFVADIRNMKFAIGKIRKEVIGKDLSVIPWSGWMPDRGGQVEPVKDSWLLERLGVGNPFPILMGETVYGKAIFNVSGFDLQEGGTTIITGKKGTGKSHAAKMILLGLIEHGARCIVFDVNDEYSGLEQALKDKKTDGKIVKLEAGVNLKFLLTYIGIDVFSKVLRTQMGAGDPSIFDLQRTWGRLAKEEVPITLDSLVRALYPSVKSDEDEVNPDSFASKATAGALTRRIYGLKRTKMFTDRPDQATTIESELKKLKKGGALVFNLKGKRADVRNIVVSTVLTKLENLLEANTKYPPIFIFAEEAHLYIGSTDWDNIITRMRHLGTYQFYVTNTPTSLPEMLIRQTDNLFLFNLMNDDDYTYIAPAAKLDTDTIKHVAKALPPRTCMVMGLATKDYPFVIRTAPLHYAAGESRRFFKYDGKKAEIASFTGADDDVGEKGDDENEFSL